MKIRNIITIVAVGFLILFTTQNTSNVQIKFIFFSWSLPLIFLLYIILFGGFFMGYFYASVKGMTKTKKKIPTSENPNMINTNPVNEKKTGLFNLFTKNKKISK
jgi:uncharacterized integral membrane protein